MIARTSQRQSTFEAICVATLALLLIFEPAHSLRAFLAMSPLTSHGDSSDETEGRETSEAKVVTACRRLTFVRPILETRAAPSRRPSHSPARLRDRGFRPSVNGLGFTLRC